MIRSLGNQKKNESGPIRLERSRLCDQAAEELKRLIVQGIYPAGSRLPSGVELARQLGVTRLTVREAMAQLETSGFVRTAHGSGTYVLDPSESATLELLAQTLRAGRALRDDEIFALLEFRSIVILGFIDSLVTHTSEADVRQLETILAAERQALGDADELARLDFSFNQVLATASRNLFYVLLLRSVEQAHLHLGAIVFRAAGDGSIVVDTHAAITRALGKGDKKALRRHLETYLEGGRAIVVNSIERRKP